VRREELALLDVDRPAALRSGADEIGLPAQERRRLQHVDDFGGRGDLLGVVHVVNTGTPTSRLTFARIARPLSMPGPRNEVPARAVRLVVARLEDERNAEGRRHFLQAAGDVELELLRLDDARAGDQEERSIEADLEPAQPHAATFSARSA
jgi:hypothetical protein